MAGFFDFFGTIPHYAQDERAVARMNARHRFVVDAFRDEIAGARVLDLAAHDGRWSYAFAAAGAAGVLGIEGRQALIDLYARYPATAFKNRVTLRRGDIFEEMEAEIAAGRTYDVIGVLGIYYHIMDHFRLLQLARRLKPKLVIIDSAFFLQEGAVIRLIEERCDNVLNAIPQVDGQMTAVSGAPTAKAMEMMARAAGFALTWSDWSVLPEAERVGVKDYFRPEPARPHLRRSTCALRLA